MKSSVKSQKNRRLVRLTELAVFLWTAKEDDLSPDDRVARRAIMLRDILRSLSDGEYVTGKQLADSLSVSERELRLMIQRLQEGGWQIKGKKSHGYRING